MSEQTPAPRGKIEVKVKAASVGAFIALLLALTAENYASGLLPAWAEIPVYALLGTAVTFLGGYGARNKIDALSPSSIAAVQEWLKLYAPKR